MEIFYKLYDPDHGQAVEVIGDFGGEKPQNLYSENQDEAEMLASMQ